MRSVFHRHLFLLIGLLSLCLFFIVAGPDRAGGMVSGTMVGTFPPNSTTGQMTQTGTIGHPLAKRMASEHRRERRGD